ncbi:EAL domain-containing protein [Pseudomonas sp. ITA]|uniref:EAL domain-containing protein n=1 Tax=Pseudomonas sp. ITA TaxID=2825841 RepID=UPI002495F7A1|nr:EAL domain-containing protein [Pseudomonas sp. ITA]MDI2145865.1 EAL domain-containing protein [Pseudomonas sp. ITA]
MAAAWIISNQLTFNQTFANLNAFVLQSRVRTGHIDAQVNTALQSLNAFTVPPGRCSVPLLKELGQVVRDSPYVYDAALRIADGTVCSSYGYELPKQLVPQFNKGGHYLGPDREYGFPDARDPSQAFIVIASKQAYVWVNKGIFFDALQTPSSMTLHFIDANDLHPVLVKEALPFSAPPSLKLGQLTATEGYWYLAFPTQWSNVIGVASLSAAVVQHAWWTNFLLALLGCALLSLGVFHAGVVIYRRHFSFASHIARAIRHNQLTLNYQPIVDLRTGQWRGAEALLRWSVRGQLISPLRIVSEVERSGLVGDLTRWVCRRVAEDYATFFQHGDGQYFTINLSGDDLADPQFVDFISALLAQYNVPAAFIVFELTESVLVDKDRATVQLQRLRDRGHRIALDDFGTGYSNLSYLEHLPIDILKIDRSFLALERYRAPDAMWRQVLGIARALQLSVVAEGVEYPEQAEVLSRAAVPLAQGWLYSEALSAQQFAQLSKDGSELKFA